MRSANPGSGRKASPKRQAINNHHSEPHSLKLRTPQRRRGKGVASGPETGCEALIQAQGQRHPQSAKRYKFHILNHNSLNSEHPSAGAATSRFFISTSKVQIKFFALALGFSNLTHTLLIEIGGGIKCLQV